MGKYVFLQPHPQFEMQNYFLKPKILFIAMTIFYLLPTAKTTTSENWLQLVILGLPNS